MDHMLIDARNAIYRAIYAGLSDNTFKDDPCLIFYRFLNSYYNKFTPARIHLFWDSPKESLWRRKIYKFYKDGRDHSRPDVDIDAMLLKTSISIAELSSCLGMRNYALERQEADDLIYAFCRSHCRKKILIVSSDGDFKQICHQYPSVSLLNPLNSTVFEVEDLDPVAVKCLTGENGDNIPGYVQIGPVRAKQILEDPIKRNQFFETHGEETYIRNRALIDLSVCPFLLNNMSYIDEVFRQPIDFNIKDVYNIIVNRKIRGLSGEMNKLMLQYKNLV